MIEVNVSQYEFVHGHKPRGRGHWAFYIGYDSRIPEFMEGARGSNLTFAEAKKLAVKLARERYQREIIVCE